MCAHSQELSTFVIGYENFFNPYVVNKSTGDGSQWK